MSTSKNRPTPKRPRKGHPAKQAQTTQSVAEPKTRPTWLTLVFVALAVVASAAYTTSIIFAPFAPDTGSVLALLTVPAIATMIFVPQARSRGLHRWPVAWLIGFTSIYPLPMLIAAQAWVLASFWVFEYTPRLPERLRRKSAAKQPAA